MQKTINALIGHMNESYMRAWIRTLKTLLDECDPAILTPTDDTGQVNVDPSGPSLSKVANTTPHYLIYKLSDGLGPDLYIKILCGCGHNLVTPAIRIEVGLGTDGAGGITDSLFITSAQQASSSTIFWNPVTADSTAIVIPGQIAVVLGADPDRRPLITGFIVSRPTDLDGNWMPEGACVTIIPHVPQSVGVIQVCSVGGVTGEFTSYTGLGPMPSATGSWAVNGEVQPAAMYAKQPHHRPHTGAGLLPLDDIALNTQFDAVFAGSTPKTYKHIGLNLSYTYQSSSTLLVTRYPALCPRIS